MGGERERGGGLVRGRVNGDSPNLILLPSCSGVRMGDGDRAGCGATRPYSSSLPSRGFVIDAVRWSEEAASSNTETGVREPVDSSDSAGVAAVSIPIT